jgi:tetratricopeptide (TPR) repeat protein
MSKKLPYRNFLRNYSMPHILISLNRERANGILSVTAQGMTKKILFDKGNATFASSTYEDDRLGEMLLKAGRINVEELEDAVSEMKRTGKRLGAILVDMGHLTPKGLFWGVKYQVQEIIYSLFHLKDGLYEFIEGETLNEVITLDLSMASIIYEGVSRIDEWTRIKSEMPDSDTVLVLSDDPLSLFQAVELNDQDKSILSLIDGQGSIKQVVDASGLNSFDAMKSLYSLWTIGIVVESTGQSEVSLSLVDILAPVDDSKDKFVSKVENVHSRLGTISHYQLLEVGEDADFEQISEQYYKLSKQFHPDRYAGSLDIGVKSKVTEVFDAINYAFESLKQSLISPQFSEGDEDLAMAMLKSAKEEIKKSNLEQAEDYLREALKYEPENAECWNYLSLVFLKMKGREEEAEQALRKALEINPGNDNYVSNLGLLYLKLGRLDEAKSQFERALSLNPDNDRAQQGLSKVLIG